MGKIYRRLLSLAVVLPLFLFTFGGVFRGGAVAAGIGVSRAAAIKTVALAFHSKGEIDRMARVITFSDTSPDKWYDRYINAAYADGFISGYGGAFRPEEPLTRGEAATLLKNIGGREAVKAANEPIPYGEWVKLFARVSGGLAAIEFTPLVTGETYPALGENAIIADIGALGSAGVDLGAYVDKKISALARDNEICAVLGVVSEAPVLSNALIIKAQDGYITVFIGGAERTYSFNSTINIKTPVIDDITIKGKAAYPMNAGYKKIRGELSRVGENEAVIGGAAYKVSGDCRVYSALGAASGKRLSDITIGTDSAAYYIRDGLIVGAVIDAQPAIENIRVLISTTGFGGYVHKKVALSAVGGLVVAEGGAANEYKKDFSISGGGQGRRVTIKAKDGGSICIENISRDEPKGKPPEYRGTIELIGASGGWYIINELPLEEYLYAVVPSETPTGYGLEALKCQAVTARSYAYASALSNKYASYGANVDDSVLSQVYNNIPENELSRQAVDATKGEYLTYNGEVVMANFFSTSAGVTANYGEVWGGKSFPGETPEYLSSARQYKGADYGDLSDEKNFGAFIKDNNIDSYDAGFPWFRWKVSMTAKQIEAAVNKNIAARYAAAPQRIKTLEGGKWVSKHISGVGSVKGVEVVARGGGGNVTKLKITGTAATVMIEAELNIRYVLSPSAVTISRQNSTDVKGYALLPSAFFVIEDWGGGQYMIYGGGNGHGVGMSQNGAKAMTDAGYTYKEILAHYFRNTKVVDKGGL